RLAAERTDANDRLVGERMIGVAQHYLGDQASARRHIEPILGQYAAPDQRSQIIRFQFDQRVTARVTLARILWCQGFPDQATRAAEASIADARTTDHLI